MGLKLNKSLSNVVNAKRVNKLSICLKDYAFNSNNRYLIY